MLYVHSYPISSLVVDSSPRISGFSYAATWSSSLCIVQRIEVFVNTLSMLQPWEGGYDRLEQALLAEIQRCCNEIVENYNNIISLHEALCTTVYGTSNKKRIDESSFDGNTTTIYGPSVLPCSSNTAMKFKFAALPRWITDLITMQTPILRQIIKD